MTGGTFMNFDVFEKKAKELGVLGIVVTKDGKEIGKMKNWWTVLTKIFRKLSVRTLQRLR